MTNTEIFKDPTYSLNERVEDLLARMTIREKLAILIETSPANERVGIPKYNHGNEALHGVVRPGNYTVFPQAIALAATFDDGLIEEIADAISDESRAVHHHGKGVCVTEEQYEGRYNACFGWLDFNGSRLRRARNRPWSLIWMTVASPCSPQRDASNFYTARTRSLRAVPCLRSVAWRLGLRPQRKGK